jgi:hypothetical protein
VAYLIVSLVYVASRVLLARVGLPFGFDLDWMWLADPADLKDRLGQTLWFFHAFPPGMDLLTGVLLKIGGEQAATLAQVVFRGLGLILANALVALARAAGLSPVAAVIVAAGFLLSPPAIYFEHLYLYEWPVVTLLVLVGVTFHRACLHPAASRWLVVFALGAAIAVTRSTFHLVWLVAMVGAAIIASGPGARRAAIIGALPGLAVVVALYGKNAVVFGEFAASTFGPASFHLVTIDRMPRAERDRWLAEGRLSPFAAISPYAPPRDYAAYFASSARPGWPPQVTRLDHATVAAPNFNHWFILEAQRARRHDVAHYLSHHPIGYAGNVLAGLVAWSGPTTEWHPRTEQPGSPHAGHRRRLGGYEASYNFVLHRLVFAPVGVYVLLPLVLIWAVRRARVCWSNGAAAERARGALLAFCVFQIVFVAAVSSMATFLESSRYRFQVEPFIWILSALALVNLAPQLTWVDAAIRSNSPSSSRYPADHQADGRSPQVN